jgi:hypothetical protein
MAAFQEVFASLRVLLLNGTAKCGTGCRRNSLSSPKPDSDELDGPFSSGFLNALVAVNNSVRFSVSDRKTETV